MGDATMKNYKTNKYDVFIENAQKATMKKLWDNEADEEWERS